MSKTKTSILSLCFVFVIIAIITSCSNSNNKNKSLTDSTKIKIKAAPVTTIKPGSCEDAKLFVSKFLVKGADYARLTKSMRPTLADAKAVFVTDDDAYNAMLYVDKVYKQDEKKNDYIQPKKMKLNV